MRSRHFRGLALALGGLVLAVGRLQAGDAAPWTPPAVGAPIAEAGPTTPPPATLDRPVPRPPVDPHVRPTAYTTTSNESGSFYGSAPRPMPAGPVATDTGGGAAPYTWRQAPTPSPVAPGAAGTPGTVLPGPPPMPGADNGPVTVPNGNSSGSVIVGPTGPVLTAPGGSVLVSPGVPGVPAFPGAPAIDGCAPGGVCCDPTCCGPCCGSCCGDCCGGTCGGGTCGGCGGCGCGGFGGCGCDNCCFNNHFYAVGEYLLWWTRGSPLPPLVTTGPSSVIPPAVLGGPGTGVLFGGTDVNSGPQSGFRGFVGYWLDDDHLLGIEAGGFFLFGDRANFGATSFGSPVLARPFINALTGAQTEELVAFPGISAGSVGVSDSTRLWGAEINARTNLCCGCNYYVDGLVGFRYLSLTDTLNIGENVTVTAPGPFQGATALVDDRFAARNNFYGTQVGFAGEYRFDRFFVGGRALVALGVTQEVVNISGTTVLTTPGMGTNTFPGGLLAQTSNIGHHSRDKFGVIPEVGFNVGYQITNNIRAFVGYNFLYWNSVVRPGNQIDTRVNPNLIPPAVTPTSGPSLPGFVFHGSDFWAQGLTFGFEIRY